MGNLNNERLSYRLHINSLEIWRYGNLISSHCVLFKFKNPFPILVRFIVYCPVPRNNTLRYQSTNLSLYSDDNNYPIWDYLGKKYMHPWPLFYGDHSSSF